MNSAVVQVPDGTCETAPDLEQKIAAPETAVTASEPVPVAIDESVAKKRIHVCVTSENRLLREALVRMLTKGQSLEVTAMDPGEYFRSKSIADSEVDVLLLVSRGNFEQDLAVIRNVHLEAPGIRILVIGTSKEKGEFLQFVRAGINGYLWREASLGDVFEGIRAVQAGEAVCPGALCNVLFRYFQQESSALPCASVQQRLGLTRREQQLIPLIAKGLTNKEIANHFCLSEQTVKNHLYRMKHKIGAQDRLSIVQRYRTHGFLL
jgi:DNA-binding NarL/FixJ family response regulator